MLVLPDLPYHVLHQLERAWQARTAAFPPVIVAARPVDTLPISVTGSWCGLNCAHCGGQYLSHMRPVDQVGQVYHTSVLISGGCDGRGGVPITQHLDQLRPLLGGRRSNWHLGLVSPEDLRALRPHLDTVSFDFVGDDETIREVYGLHSGADDFERVFAALTEVTAVVPHITIGLRGGRLGHEREALRRLSGFRFERLVLLVFIPTAGTKYHARRPPALGEVADIMAEARLQFPSVSLQLGCMRPRGQYREALDVLAVQAGVNVIVNPTRPCQSVAERLGLKWVESHECCVFTPDVAG